MDTAPADTDVELTSGDSDTDPLVVFGEPHVDSITTRMIQSSGVLPVHKGNMGTTAPPEADDMDAIWPIVAGIAVVLILAAIVVGLLLRRWKRRRMSKKAKEDTFLGERNTEIIPAPVFEEDIPSVLELDMEDMDEWGMKTQ